MTVSSWPRPHRDPHHGIGSVRHRSFTGILPFLKLFASILGFVLVGTPLVAYLWDALNRLMAGHVQGRQLAIAAVASLLFAALLRLLMRALGQWEGAAAHESPAETSSFGRTRD